MAFRSGASTEPDASRPNTSGSTAYSTAGDLDDTLVQLSSPRAATAGPRSNRRQVSSPVASARRGQPGQADASYAGSPLRLQGRDIRKTHVSLVDPVNDQSPRQPTEQALLKSFVQRKSRLGRI